MWQNTPYGLSLPYVWNSISRDAYEFLRRNLHFTDNYKQQPENSEGYDPLFKVRYPLDIIGKGMRKVWTAGQHVTIDESMIKYCGRAVAFVQYMPAKPIKHGIKVSAFVVLSLELCLRTRFTVATKIRRQMEMVLLFRFVIGW